MLLQVYEKVGLIGAFIKFPWEIYFALRILNTRVFHCHYSPTLLRQQSHVESLQIPKTQSHFLDFYLWFKKFITPNPMHSLACCSFSPPKALNHLVYVWIHVCVLNPSLRFAFLFFFFFLIFFFTHFGETRLLFMYCSLNSNRKCWLFCRKQCISVLFM